MAVRFAPTTELGLAIPPKKRGCVGEMCPIAEQEGVCYPDDHHLYFPEKKFLAHGHLYEKLRRDTHSFVRIARCRHDSADERAQHSMYDSAYFPEPNAIKRYLEESSNLSLLGVQVDGLAIALDVLTNPVARQDEGEIIEDIGLKQENISELLVYVGSLEVIPGQICLPAISKIRTTYEPMIPLVDGLLAS